MGGRAKPRAVTRVNLEQASKVKMRAPIRLNDGEGRSGERSKPRRAALRLAGVVRTARGEGLLRNVGGPLGEAGRDCRRQYKLAALTGVGEAHGTDEAGNDGGGTGPCFWVSSRQARVRGLT